MMEGDIAGEASRCRRKEQEGELEQEEVETLRREEGVGMSYWDQI